MVDAPDAETIEWGARPSCPSAPVLRECLQQCRALGTGQTIRSATADSKVVHVTARSRDGRFMAFGDSAGTIHLFHEATGAYRAIAAHACHVTALDFNADGSLLLSAGSPDLCVKQWRTVS